MMGGGQEINCQSTGTGSRYMSCMYICTHGCMDVSI